MLDELHEGFHEFLLDGLFFCGLVRRFCSKREGVEGGRGGERGLRGGLVGGVERVGLQILFDEKGGGGGV